MKWPDVPRTVFGSGHPTYLNAHVGWVQRSPDLNMLGYAEGYQAAAEAIFQAATNRAASCEKMVFPLAFAWRHFVELTLKDIIAIGAELDGAAPDFPKHHRLTDLWERAKPTIQKCGDPRSPWLDNVEAALQEFVTIDPLSMGFRYPLDRDGTPHQLPEHVNLVVLHESMGAVGNFLSSVRYMLAGFLDDLRDARSQT